jgi:hypothetical protein
VGLDINTIGLRYQFPLTDAITANIELGNPKTSISAASSGLSASLNHSTTYYNVKA